MEEEKPKSNRGRKTLTDNQKKFCQLVVSGKEPLEAMLEVFPSRATYSIGNQRMLLKKMQEHPLIKKQLAEMFTELRESNVIGNAYDFNKGVALLNEEIQLEFLNEEKLWNMICVKFQYYIYRSFMHV